MNDSDEDLIPCPSCGSLNVKRHYLRQGDEAWPGCLDCETTMPLEEWREAVAAKTSHWQNTPRPS